MSNSKKKSGEDQFDEIKSSISSLEQRVEELMELQRQGNGLEEDLGLDTLPGFPQYSPGSVMVGIPKFFDYNHLAQVDRTYADIKNHWTRGRLTAWNAQMRFAQLANDRDSMCLFMMLQLEALTQLLLPLLFVKRDKPRRDFTLDKVYDQATGKASKKTMVPKDSLIDLVPHMPFAIRTDVKEEDGVYARVKRNLLSDNDSFKYRQLNAGEFGDTCASILSVDVPGLTREEKLYEMGTLITEFEVSDFFAVLTAPVPWKELFWLEGCWLWLSRESIAEFRGDVLPMDRSIPFRGRYHPKGRVMKFPKEALPSFERKYWKLVLPAPQGLEVVSSGWEKFPFKARYSVTLMTDFLVDFMLYSDKEWVLRDGSAAPLEVMLRYDYSGDEPTLKREAGAISVIAGRVSQERGVLHDVMGQFGKSKSSIADRICMMMQVSPEGLDTAAWDHGGSALNLFHSIKNMRNNLVHGNLGDMSKGRSSLSMDDIASFWDYEVVPRISHWIHEASS